MKSKVWMSLGSAALILLALAWSVAAQQDGGSRANESLLPNLPDAMQDRLATETIDCSAPFSQIALFGSMNLVAHVAKKAECKIVGDKDRVSNVALEISEGILKVRPKDPNQKAWQSEGSCTVFVVAPSIRTVSAFGAGNVKLTGLAGGPLTLAIFGSGVTEAAGSVESLLVDLKGSGNVNAQELAAGNAEVSIRGSGSASVRVTGHLNASILGSGSVHYFGTPKTIHRNIMGTGSVSEKQ